MQNNDIIHIYEHSHIVLQVQITALSNGEQDNYLHDTIIGNTSHLWKPHLRPRQRQK
jgi:hypothetical protein